jgi:hypothetical protein
VVAERSRRTSRLECLVHHLGLVRWVADQPQGSPGD